MLTVPTSIPASETERRAAASALVVKIGTRVYPVREPQDAPLPGIVYFKVSGRRLHLLAKRGNLAHPRFQFDIYAEGSDGYKTCKAIARDVRHVLDGFRGVVIGVDIQSVQLEDESDPYEEEPELYRVSMDFMVMHRET